MTHNPPTIDDIRGLGDGDGDAARGPPLGGDRHDP